MLWLLSLALTVGSSTWLVRRRRSLDRRVFVAGWVLPAAAFAAALYWWPSLVALRKLIGLLLMPAGFLWLALILWFLLARRRKRPRLLLGTLLVLYTLAGSPWTGWLLMRVLESPYRGLRPLEDAATYDAVLVLGGGSAMSPAGSPQLGSSGDRLRLAAALWAAGRTPLLVTSGSSVDRRRDLSAETRELWLQMGVAQEAILRLPGPRNTAEEIATHAELAAKEGWQKVGLVTSARHMRRAEALCQRHGLDITPLPAEFRARAFPTWTSAAIPRGSGFAMVEQASWEMLGLAAVRLFGG